MTAELRGWDGSVRRTADLGVPGSDWPVVVWETARVVAGEPIRLSVLAISAVRHDAFAWLHAGRRWAGTPVWGHGPPPAPAGLGAEPTPPAGVGPDGAPSWTQATRFIAVPGTRGDDDHDQRLLTAALAEYGPVDVLVGHGHGARRVQVHDDSAPVRVLIDGGVPVGVDADDAPLRRSWDIRPPAALITALGNRSRYLDADVRAFLRERPATTWQRVPDTDHDTVATGERAARMLPGAIWRAYLASSVS